MSHDPLQPDTGAQGELGAMPARVGWLFILANAFALAALAGLMAWANQPLASAAGSWLSAMGVSASDVMWAETHIRLGLTFIEFALATWLVYSVLIPRVWPEESRRRAGWDEKWTKEEVIIFLLVILIALEIFD